MLVRLAARMLRDVGPRQLLRFAYRFGWQGARAVVAFRRRAETGGNFPAFLFVSVTDCCNLSCKGCWVGPDAGPDTLPPERLEALIAEAAALGSRFFGILGGEPLLYPGLTELFRNHPECYFQLFTNGTLLSPAIATELRDCGNVTPLISIEGMEAESDRRRGGSGVFAGARTALEHCRTAGLITGAASSLCRDNFDELATEAYLDFLLECGAHYAWYYIYRPCGPRPCPELALTRAQVARLREFVVGMRGRKPLALVDSYWDADGRALCPAATGIAYHVNPRGDVEPCPPVQFSDANVCAPGGAAQAIGDSRFLPAFAAAATADNSRGCILMENPAALVAAAAACGAHCSSGRDGAAELAALPPCPSHDLAGAEIPERHWFYRFAKRRWFFGFGAYG